METGADVSPAETSRIRKETALVALVEAMGRGEQNALAELYDLTSPLLNGLLRRALKHREDAEEALLDVYMKAWKNAVKYTASRGTVQTWLVMMARSVAIDRIRRRGAEPSTAAWDAGDTWDFVSPEDSPEEKTIEARRRAAIQQILAELPAQYRKILLMAFFAGFTHSELAERLGEPLGTVKSRIRMALMKVRTLLGEDSRAGEKLA